MHRNDRVFCREAHDVTDPLLRAAEQLYNSTQHPDERIPWGWIARSLKGRVGWRPGDAHRHLLLAVPGNAPDDPAQLAGFAYGTHIPSFGGYVSYLGVAEAFRGRGVGQRLFQQLFRVLAADAGAGDEPLPVVVWESKPPGPAATATDLALWQARLALFGKAGGHLVEGLDLHTPNYANAEADPVRFKLFVKPVEWSVKDMTATRLQELAAGLLDHVYRLAPADPLVQATLAGTGCDVRLVPLAPPRRAAVGV